MRRGIVFIDDRRCGEIWEGDDGFLFSYDKEYLKRKDARPVSLTLPLSEEAYVSKTMFPFFDGLIPEGWLLEIAKKNWKLDERDRMGLLLSCCRDPIGNVWIEEEQS